MSTTECYCQACGAGPFNSWRTMPWLAVDLPRNGDYERVHVIVGCVPCNTSFQEWKENRFKAIHMGSVPSGGYADLVDWEPEDDPYFGFLTPFEEVEMWKRRFV